MPASGAGAPPDDSIRPPMTTERSALEKAIAEIRHWHDRNPDKKLHQESDDVAKQRLFVMQVLSGLREGEEDPWLGKKIRKIVRKSTRYIVYLDENLEAQWWWINRLAADEGMSIVQANISRLEADSAFLGSEQLDLRMRPVPASSFWRGARKVFGAETAEQMEQHIKTRAEEKLESIRALIAESMAMILNGASVRDCEKV